MKYFSILFFVFLSGCSGLQLTGGLGLQAIPSQGGWDYIESNDYGPMIGKVELTQPVFDDFYISAFHISGINTAEGDLGMNAVTAGFLVEF